MTETPTAADAETFESRLMAAVEHLSEILEREVALLEDMRADALASLLPDKRAAAKEYRLLLGRLAAQPDLAADLAAPMRQRLESAGRRLTDAAAANARALGAGIAANNRLVRTVAETLEKDHGARDSYLPDGRPDRPRSAAAPVAVTFNQVL